VVLSDSKKEKRKCRTGECRSSPASKEKLLCKQLDSVVNTSIFKFQMPNVMGALNLFLPDVQVTTNQVEGLKAVES
jgi:hypothetical protein